MAYATGTEGIVFPLWRRTSLQTVFGAIYEKSPVLWLIFEVQCLHEARIIITVCHKAFICKIGRFVLCVYSVIFVSDSNRLHSCNLDPNSSAFCLLRPNSRTKSFKYACVIKHGVKELVDWYDRSFFSGDDGSSSLI